MKDIRCIIVDDEPLARLHLKLLLAQESGIEVAGEAGSGKEASEVFHATKPNLVFLDINFRNETGFDIVDRYLQNQAKIIFVTAHEQFAARAFDVQALDYLLKPIKPSRLHEAIEKLRDIHSPAPTTLVPVGTSGRLVCPTRICYVQAANQNTRVTIENHDTITVRESLSHWMQKLPSPPFSQIDRSLVVNMDKIVSVKYRTRSAEVLIGETLTKLHIGAKGMQRLRLNLANRSLRDQV